MAVFGAREARRSFGREAVTAALLDRLARRLGRGPVALVAPSGAGRSSLLMAGLLPAVRDGALCDGPPPETSSPMEQRRDGAPPDRAPPTAHSDCGYSPAVVGTPTARPPAALLWVLESALGELALELTADQPPRGGGRSDPHPTRPLPSASDHGMVGTRRTGADGRPVRGDLHPLRPDESERHAFVRLLHTRQLTSRT
ncbi:nSTAND1 domain-containing NTPase [Kitasatospora sp. HPMI-4]|uniref:nSTAND1 domain-containing NTPase n=1 Tax=Kitasatospora sp. HPMI-4 TaxID=3448443 RepID=UPI003F1CEC74